MAHPRTAKISVSLVAAVIGVLILLHTLPVLAQAPSFAPPVTYASGGYQPLSVALGDLNGDGILDIVVVNQCVASDSCPSGGGYVCLSADYCSHGAVGVLLGNGDGTFRPAVTYETGGYLSSSVALGDLNGDGKVDLVVVNDCGAVPIDSDGKCPYATVDVMFGNGDGTFGAPFTSPVTGWYPVSVALGDLNGDGRLDVVVADLCNMPNTCSAEGCTCTGGLVEVPGGTYDSGAPFARSMALADVNRDGKLDILVGNDGYAGVLLGNGDGTFKPAVTYGSGDAITVGDVNGDGKPDLLGAVSSSSLGQASVLLGNGDGTFRPAAYYPTGGQYARSVAVADVNGDGNRDVVVANLFGIWPDQRAIGVLIGNGDGSFQPPVTFDSGGVENFSVALGDLNKDGKPDLVVVNGNVGVLLNNAQICMTPPTITFSAGPTLLWPPNGEMIPVKVSGKIADAGAACSVKFAAYRVTDEYGKVQPGGPVTLGPGGAFSFTVPLQASRFGNDIDGRLYTVTVTAATNSNKTSSKSGTVVVPHDQR